MLSYSILLRFKVIVCIYIVNKRAMAQCCFSGAGGQCGTSVDEPGNVGCVSIADCWRKIKGHLATIKVTDCL